MSTRKVYIRKQSFVEAVQWLGSEKGPHDLGIDGQGLLRDPAGFSTSKIVQSGDWLVWTITSYRGVRLVSDPVVMREDSFKASFDSVPEPSERVSELVI